MNAPEPTPEELAEHALDIAEKVLKSVAGDVWIMGDMVKTGTTGPGDLSLIARGYTVALDIEGALDAVAYALELLEGGAP
jgi:hypothetical protein